MSWREFRELEPSRPGEKPAFQNLITMIQEFDHITHPYAQIRSRDTIALPRHRFGERCDHCNT